MIEYPQVHHMLQSPLAKEVEVRFVSNMRKMREQGCLKTYSLQQLLELLGKDLTFAEIGARLGVPKFIITSHYERYCRDFFGGETGLERRNRISSQRRAAVITELLRTPITNPWLLKVAEIARSKGCQVTSYVSGTQNNDKLRVSPFVLYIDGKSCYIHRMQYLHHDSKIENSPRSYIQFSSYVIDNFDFRNYKRPHS